MASATFTLRAVDATRAAFASVQNSLQKTSNYAKNISKNLTTFFGLRAAVAGVRQLNSALEEAEKNGGKLGLTQDEIDGLTNATNLYDRAVQNIQISFGKLGSLIASAFGKSPTPAADALVIRNDRLRDQVREINQELEKQIMQNDLLLKNDGARIPFLENQLQAARMRAKMGKDDLEIAQANLEVEKIKGELTVANQKIQEDHVSLLEDQFQLRRELNKAVGIEEDQGALIADLLKKRLELTLEIKEADALTPQGLADQNLFRAERNKLDRELIPLLNERYTLEKQIGSTVADSLQTAILEGGKFTDVLREMGAQLLKLLLYQMVTRRIASAITGFLIPNPLAAISVGELVTKIPARANGGPVTANRAHIVGERGPELFIPNSSGTIISNSAMQRSNGSSAMMGSGVTVNYHIAAGVTRAELAPILDAERQRLKAEIPDMVRRGGAYRAAFA